MPEPTSLIPPESSSVSVRKILDANISRMTVEPPIGTGKLLDRRATPRRPHHPETYSQSRIFSVTNHLPQRQASSSVPTNAVLPTVVGKRTNQSFRLIKSSNVKILS